MKVLIIQSAFIGDVVLAVPLAETVKQSSPGNEVHFLTMPVYGDFLSKQPSISKVVIDDKKGGNRCPFSFLKFCMRLRKEKYDIALIIHRSFRTGLLARIAGIKRRIGFDTAEGRFFYTETVSYRRSMHEVERNLL
ncbi:MAG: glycosyltransferase family 9 protein, partial [bacterium]